MRMDLSIGLGPVRSRLYRIFIVASFLTMAIGIGMLLYRVEAQEVLQVQGSQTIETVGLASQLKGNASKTFGPISALQGSWFALNVASNKTISLRIRSNSTGTILNSTGTLFAGNLLLYNSTDYYLTTINSKGAAASVSGNATLVVLSVANLPVQKTTHPLLGPGAAFATIGAVTLFYVSLPREPSRRRSFDRLFP